MLLRIYAPTKLVPLTQYSLTLAPRYPGWPDFTNFVRDNGVSGTTGEASVQGNLEFIEIHTD